MGWVEERPRLYGVLITIESRREVFPAPYRLAGIPPGFDSFRQGLDSRLSAATNNVFLNREGYAFV